MKEDLSQKIHGNMMFSVCSAKMVFLFHTNMIQRTYIKTLWKYDVFCRFGKDGVFFPYKYEITLLSKKAKMIFSRKIRLKMTFPASLKKMILILEKMILAFQIDNLERVPMILCTFIETFLSVFIYCIPTKKKPGNLSEI